MYTLKQILKMDLINLFTNPMWLFYNIGFALLLVLILGFLSSGGYGGDITAYDYYAVALMIYAIANTATISANSFMEERIKNGNMRVIYSPVPSWQLHFSKVIASFVFGVVCHTAVGLILHLLIGVHYGSRVIAVAAILLLMAAAELFAAALGVFLCCVFKSEGVTNQILSLVITILALLGGLFFPVDGMGTAVASVSNISPLKWLTLAAFQVIYDDNFTLLVPVGIGLVVLSFLAAAASAKIFKGEDYLL